MAGFNRGQRAVLLLGISLILLGALFLVLQIAGVPGVGAWMPAVAGLIFLGLAFASRLPSFFLVACLLVAGGGGLLFYTYAGPSVGEETSAAVFLIFVSVGFFAAGALTKFLTEKGLRWPLAAGGAALVIGILLLSFR